MENSKLENTTFGTVCSNLMFSCDVEPISDTDIHKLNSKQDEQMIVVSKVLFRESVLTKQNNKILVLSRFLFKEINLIILETEEDKEYFISLHHAQSKVNLLMFFKINNIENLKNQYEFTELKQQ